MDPCRALLERPISRFFSWVEKSVFYFLIRNADLKEKLAERKKTACHIAKISPPALEHHITSHHLKYFEKRV